MQTARPQSIYKAVIAGGIGNLVEWYTFLVYAFLTPEISRLFFPHVVAERATFFSLLIFAAGFLARPIGAVLFGYLGDKVGRRFTLILSQTLMLLTSLAMTITPTYASIGIYAPAALTALRILQGISIAGEYTTSLCYIAEVAKPNQRGKWVSTIPASTAFGILFSSLVVYTITKTLTYDELLQWGWRLAFSLGALLAAVGAILRVFLPETEVFLHAKKHLIETKESATTLLFSTNTLKPMLKVTILVIAYSYFYQLLFVWLPVKVMATSFKSHDYALFINVIAMLIFMGAIIYGGILADKYGEKKIMLSAEIAILLLCLPFTYLLSKNFTPETLLSYLILFSIIFGTYVGSASSYFSKAYIPEVRATALALSYNIPYAIFGGLTPAFLSALTAHTSFISNSFITCGIFIIALIATLY